MAEASGKKCCVPGCNATGKHEKSFTIVIESGYGGEIGTSSHFCCEHLDMFANNQAPFLDLAVIGVVCGG